jgi:hypothetical protein
VERELGEMINKAEQRSDWSGALRDEQLNQAAAGVLVLPRLLQALNKKLALAKLERTAEIEVSRRKQDLTLDSAAFLGVGLRQLLSPAAQRGMRPPVRQLKRCDRQQGQAKQRLDQTPPVCVFPGPKAQAVLASPHRQPLPLRGHRPAQPGASNPVHRWA